MPEGGSRIRIIGPGRAGTALAAALLDAEAVASVDLVGRRASPPPLARHDSRVAFATITDASAPPPPDLVVIAVPDDEIARVADTIAAQPLARDVPILHLSGALGRGALHALEERGHPTGSLHPLVALSDEAAAISLRGAWYAVEGDPAAVAAADRLVEALGGRSLSIDAGGKPLYHAAAVAASNLVVGLLSLAEKWMIEAGVGAGDARAALTSLASGAVQGVERAGPIDALTGPVARGDAGTVRAHLVRLSPPDRAVYSLLSLAAVELALQGGLDTVRAAELRRLLESTE